MNLIRTLRHGLVAGATLLFAAVTPAQDRFITVASTTSTRSTGG